MTPKEKAEYLIDKFLEETQYESEYAKELAAKCALIAVDEIINNGLAEKNAKIAMLVSGYVFPHHYKEYWEEVRKEISNL